MNDCLKNTASKINSDLSAFTQRIVDLRTMNSDPVGVPVPLPPKPTYPSGTTPPVPVVPSKPAPRTSAEVDAVADKNISDAISSLVDLQAALSKLV